MAVLNPLHLFEQAEKLILPPPAGPPRQVDIRRAISAAYYGVFHHVLTATADEFVGASKKTSARYGLVYRSVDHRALRDVCSEIKKQQPAGRYRRYMLLQGPSANLQAFATAFLNLYEQRHLADYDPAIRLKRIDAVAAVATGKGAIARFNAADVTSRQMFLTLLLCPPR